MRVSLFLTGKTIRLDVTPDDYIYQLKELLQEREGIPPDQCLLIFAGKRLEDGHTLLDYSIMDTSTISVILQARADVPSRNDIPPESVYPSLGEEEEIVQKWHTLARDGGFEADTHIIDPQAHYAAVESLEKTIVTSSEVYRRSGVLDQKPTSENIMLRLLDIQSPEWIHNLLLDAGGGVEVVDDEAVLSLCESYVILQSVVKSFDLLVSRMFSHEFFSILLLRGHRNIAEIVKIPRAALGSIVEAAFTALANARYETREVIAEVVKPAMEQFMDLIGHEPLSSDPLEACRVVSHLLDLGLVSYVGSHGSRFDQEYFKADIASFNCNKNQQFGFECNLRTLACLNGFLDARAVWVFEVKHQGISLEAWDDGAKGRLSILTTIDALSDIWGPIYAEAVNQDPWIEKPYRVKKYNVSKGCIRRVPNRNGSSDGVVKCHWYSWAEEQRRRFSSLFSGFGRDSEDLTMSVDDKLLIGTEMTVKPDCTFSLTEYEINYSSAILRAGPRPSTWKFDGLAVSLEIAAPKVVMFQIKGKAKKIPETTIKEHAWQRWSTTPESANPGILNSYFGVEISNCTGNARRVPLKQILLMHPVQELLERQIPGWQSRRWGKDFIKALQTESDDAVFQFWKHHVAERPLAGRLISSVLDVLDCTGCNEAGLQAAFLHQNYESIVTIDPTDNDWASLLKDSYLTATYAIVNEICLEYKLPDHSASICNNEKRYSVLQTKIGMEAGNELRKRCKIDPHGLMFKKIGSDPAASPYLLARESAFRSMVLLGAQPGRAKELLYQYPHDPKRHHKVVLRAKRESFGGMPYLRQRNLVKADECLVDIEANHENMNQEVMNEALSQLEIEAMILEDLAREVAEDDQRARC